MPAELAIFRPETGEEGGSPTVNRTVRRVRPELGQRHCAQLRNQDLPEQMHGLSAAASRPTLAAAGAATRASAFARTPRAAELMP